METGEQKRSAVLYNVFESFFVGYVNKYPLIVYLLRNQQTEMVVFFYYLIYLHELHKILKF